MSIVFLISCDTSKTQTERKDTGNKTTGLTHSLRSKLTNALESIVEQNSNPDDVTISGKYIEQGKYNNGDYYPYC